jgi:hypothetical protein
VQVAAAAVASRTLPATIGANVQVADAAVASRRVPRPGSPNRSWGP